MDQVDRIIVEVKNAEEIKRLTADLEKERDTLKGLAVELHDGVKDLQQYQAAAEGPAAKVANLTSQIKKLEGQTRDYGRATLETGRIVQDFTQGGIGGILNNVEGLVLALGGPTGLAGLLTAVGVAAYVATPLVKGLWNELTGDGQAIPETNDLLESLTTRLNEGKKALKEMTEEWSGSKEEVAAYNEQLSQNVELEKKANAERERRAAMKSAQEQKTPEQSALADAFGKVSGGADYDKIVANAGANTPQGRYNALKAEYDALAAKFRGGGTLDAGEQARYADLSRQMNAAAAGGGIDGNNGVASNERAMQDLVNAARKGDRGAFDKLLGLTTGGVRDQLGDIDPSKAGSKAFNKQLAEGQIRDAIGGFLTPLISTLKEAAAQAKAEADVGKPGPGRGAAIDAVRDMRREQERAEARAGVAAPGRGAAIDAVNDMKADQLRSIRRQFDTETGGRFAPEQVNQAAEMIQRSVNRGANLGQAMQKAFSVLAQNVDMIGAQQAAQAQWWERARQGQQITRSRMGRARPG